MKKIYSLAIATGVLFAAFLAPRQANAQALEQGNSSLDIYYGSPSLLKTVIKSVTDNSSAKLSALGPVGAKFEYMVSDKVGVGLEYNYTSYDVTWNQVDSASQVNYHYEFKYAVNRIMPRFNIHFGSSENFDGYFGVAAGYRFGSVTYNSNDPNYNGSWKSNPIPFAMRVAVGGRYYFTDNFGLHLEFGLGGGSLLQGGLSFKF